MWVMKVGSLLGIDGEKALWLRSDVAVLASRLVELFQSVCTCGWSRDSSRATAGLGMRCFTLRAWLRTLGWWEGKWS
jgi:hypothetical protein